MTPYRRTRTANTAVWISDEFMKRVQNDEPWYLFDPLETPDLNELYGAEFSKRYQEYADMAEAGELRMFKKLGAREQFKAILVSLQGTSHPWLTWKDTINNRRHQQQHWNHSPVQPLHGDLSPAGC